jgi:hypothetical protein
VKRLGKGQQESEGAAEEVGGFAMQTATPRPLLKRGMCPHLPKFALTILLWSHRQGSPLTRPLAWPDPLTQSLSRP